MIIFLIHCTGSHCSLHCRKVLLNYPADTFSLALSAILRTPQKRYIFKQCTIEFIVCFLI